MRLADPGVRFLDANGDGRADLMVTNGPLAGYFPMRADARMGRRLVPAVPAGAELQPVRP